MYYVRHGFGSVVLGIILLGLASGSQAQQQHGSAHMSRGQATVASPKAPMMQQMRGMMTQGGMMGHGLMLGHGRMMLRKMERVMQQLKLTEAQKSKVRSLMRSALKEAIRTTAEIAVKRVDLWALLDAEPVDLPQVKTLLQSIASKQAELRFAHIRLKQEISTMLTPEQRKQFRSMWRNLMPPHGGKMGPGGVQNPCGMLRRSPGNQ